MVDRARYKQNLYEKPGMPTERADIDRVSLRHISIAIVVRDDLIVEHNPGSMRCTRCQQSHCLMLDALEAVKFSRRLSDGKIEEVSSTRLLARLLAQALTLTECTSPSSFLLSEPLIARAITHLLRRGALSRT